MPCPDLQATQPHTQYAHQTATHSAPPADPASADRRTEQRREIAVPSPTSATASIPPAHSHPSTRQHRLPPIASPQPPEQCAARDAQNKSSYPATAPAPGNRKRNPTPAAASPTNGRDIRCLRA